MNVIGIIPARYASTRFPGKPLADIGGQPMIQRVYQKVAELMDKVVVATDDDRIYQAVKAFGGEVVMTGIHHKSGTDRCQEAVKKARDLFAGDFDVVVNIQGDEPFIRKEQIQTLLECFQDSQTQIATLVKAFEKGEDIFNPNTPKVVLNKYSDALFFSRSPIPFLRGVEATHWSEKHTYFKHIGLYAYRYEVLKEITQLEQSPLELAESLEQLRWLENGYKIKVGVTPYQTIGIDTPEDLEKAISERLWDKENN